MNYVDCGYLFTFGKGEFGGDFRRGVPLEKLEPTVFILMLLSVVPWAKQLTAIKNPPRIFARIILSP